MSICSIRGCGKELFGKGLCNMHYSRLRRHGSLEAARPDDWGSRREHPLYDAWRELNRKNAKPSCQEWRDFWVFAKDVGERPGDKFFLSRLDDNQPFSAANFMWREKIVVKENDESTKEYKARYQREYRKLHPEKMKGYHLKQYFGLPQDEYEALCEKYSNLCAICKRPERNKRLGEAYSLAVDHDHATGKVRGLLCANCNRALGLLEDNPSFFQAAIEYLESHQEVKNGDKETNDDRPQAQDQNERS